VILLLVGARLLVGGACDACDVVLAAWW